MAEVLYYAIPGFVLLLAMELLSFKYLRDDDLVGYEALDTRTSPVLGAADALLLSCESGSGLPSFFPEQLDGFCS